MPAAKNPFCLDRLTPAGTNTRLTANYDGQDGTHPKTYGNPSAGDDLWASLITVRMSSSSPGPKGYFGYVGMVPATGVGVLREILPGETMDFAPPRGGSLLHVGDYCVVGDDNTDYFQASAWVS